MDAKKGKGPLGKNVLHLRAMRGLTRRVVADAIGIDDDQPIYALESRNSTRSEHAPALAKFFNVDLELLITRDLTGMTWEEIAQLSQESKLRPEGARDPFANRPRAVTEILHRQGDLNGEDVLKLIQWYIEATDEGRKSILDLAELAPKIRAIGSGARDKSK